MRDVVFTIGHSNHTLERLISLSSIHDISVIGDVRSTPYSRRSPQFNTHTLTSELRARRMEYVYLGRELGARPANRNCNVNGRVDFGRLASTESFSRGLQRVADGADRRRFALLCAEKEPLDCHRCILVRRHLDRLGITVCHILEDGRLEYHDDTVIRLLDRLGHATGDLFLSHAQLIDEAYDRRGKEIAFQLPTRADDLPNGASNDEYAPI